MWAWGVSAGLRALAPQHSCPSRLLGCCGSLFTPSRPRGEAVSRQEVEKGPYPRSLGPLGVCSLSAQNRVSSPGAGGPRAVATAGNLGGGQDRAEAGAEPGRASRGVYGEGGVNSGFRCGMPELKAESTEDSDGRFWDRVHRVKGLGSGWYD